MTLRCPAVERRGKHLLKPRPIAHGPPVRAKPVSDDRLEPGEVGPGLSFRDNEKAGPICRIAEERLALDEHGLTSRNGN